MPRAVNGMKVCSRKDCHLAGIPQPVANFHRCKAYPDGLTYACRTCVTADQIRHRDRIKAYSRKWASEHPEYNAERSRQWRRINPEKAAAGVKNWDDDHPGKIKAYEQRRRALKRGASEGALFTRDDLISKYGSTCYLCGHEIDLTLRSGGWAYSEEHIVPLSRGGSHSIENARPAHRSCNSRKNDRLLSELPPLPWDPPPTA